MAQRSQIVSVQISKRTVALRCCPASHSEGRLLYRAPTVILQGASARKPLELGALGLCNLRRRGPKTANAVGYGPLIVGVICKAFPQASSYRQLNES